MKVETLSDYVYVGLCYVQAIPLVEFRAFLTR